MEAFIHSPPFFEPMIILNLLDLLEEIRNEPSDFRRNAYLSFVFKTIVDWLDPIYPH